MYVYCSPTYHVLLLYSTVPDICSAGTCGSPKAGRPALSGAGAYPPIDHRVQLEQVKLYTVHSLYYTPYSGVEQGELSFSVLEQVQLSLSKGSMAGNGVGTGATVSKQG